MTTILLDAADSNEDFKKILLYKIPFFSEKIVEVNDQGSSIAIVLETDPGLEFETALKKHVEQINVVYRKYRPVTIFENYGAGSSTPLDIYAELIDRGWVVPFSNGLVGVGPDFSRLMGIFDSLIVQWGKDQGASEFCYPDMIDIESLHKCNYLQHFPSTLFFTSTIKEGNAELQRFRSRLSENRQEIPAEHLASARYVNKSAVCLHVYKQLENKTIDLQAPTVITCLGKCHRNESINVDKLERLFNFSMREVVFVGTEEYVLKMRDTFMELSRKLMQRLGLTSNIKTSNDMFFTAEYEQKALLQEKLKLKYELNISLPYDKKEISVGSFNYHRNYFADAFRIKSKDGQVVHTACVGFGLERLVYAYLSQVGLDHCYLVLEGEGASSL